MNEKDNDNNIDEINEGGYFDEPQDNETEENNDPAKKKTVAEPVEESGDVNSKEEKRDYQEEDADLNKDDTHKSHNTIVKALKGVGIGIVILVLIILGASAAFIMTLPDDRVAENVYVENLYVGGLTYDEALAAIEKTYLLEHKNITITCNDMTYTISGKEIGIGADAKSTADKAFNYGKTGVKLRDGFTALMLKFRKEVIVPTAVVNDELLDAKLNEFGVMALGELKQHEIQLTDQGAVLIPGSAGYDGDPSVARGEIKWHITYESFDNIQVTLNTKEPDPITIERLDGTVYQDPVDARFEVVNNQVNLIPEQNGRYINKEEAQAILDTFNSTKQQTVVPVYAAEANIKAADIQSKLFNATLASFSTNYSSSASGRKTNVAVAASKLNGKVVGPGERFSFNETVGKRTVENGFKEAPEYLNGESVMGIGGGTCQVSTTLFNTLLLADMKITERANHSLTVHYVPLGRDAAVADNGADLKFVNNTDYPVRLEAQANGSTITISLIGTAYEPARNVELSVSQSDGAYYLTRSTYANGELVRNPERWKSKYKNG